jgi:hypothetical protein
MIETGPVSEMLNLEKLKTMDSVQKNNNQVYDNTSSSRTFRFSKSGLVKGVCGTFMNFKN